MKKGKFGILLAYYAVIAFVLVILKQPVLIALVAAAAIFLEKDEWLSRQTIQALMLSVVVECFSTVANVFDALPLWFISDILAGIFSFVSWALYIVAIIFSILAIIKVYRENDAGVPLLSDLSYKIFGQIKPRPAPPPAPQAYPVPPQSPQQGYVPPQYQPAAPPPSAPVAPEAPVAPATPELTIDPSATPPATPPANENTDNK